MNRAQEAVRLAISSEAILSLMHLMSFVVTQAQRVAEEDPELAPELTTVVEQMTGAVNALGRAHTFAVARAEARGLGNA